MLSALVRSLERSACICAASGLDSISGYLTRTDLGEAWEAWQVWHMGKNETSQITPAAPSASPHLGRYWEILGDMRRMAKCDVWQVWHMGIEKFHSHLSCSIRLTSSRSGCISICPQSHASSILLHLSRCGEVAWSINANSSNSSDPSRFKSTLRTEQKSIIFLTYGRNGVATYGKKGCLGILFVIRASPHLPVR